MGHAVHCTLYEYSLGKLRNLASLVCCMMYSSRAKVSGRAANDPGFVKVSQNSILRISINIHCTAGELYS